MAAGCRFRRRLRGARPQDQRAQVDGQPRRPDLRLALAAPRSRGGLRVRGLEGEVREGLRGGVDQGDERGSLRSRPDSAITFRALYSVAAIEHRVDQGQIEAIVCANIARRLLSLRGLIGKAGETKRTPKIKRFERFVRTVGSCWSTDRNLLSGWLRHRAVRWMPGSSRVKPAHDG